MKWKICSRFSYYGITSIGMTFVILIAGIDLSIGSIITLVNVVCAYLMVNAGMNMWVAILISLCLSTLIGVLNGGMVATIGMQGLYGGINLVLTKGKAITGIPDEIYFLGKGNVGPIPMPFIRRER